MIWKIMGMRVKSNLKIANFMKKIFILLFLLMYFSFSLLSQEDKKEVISLSEIITMVREQSVAALLAETERETSYWEFRTFRSRLYPQVTLSGTLPDYAKTYSPVTQQNGTVEFQPVRINNSLLNLELSQNIALTGGEVFLSSQLQRFDDIERNATRYNSSPVFVGYRQRIFAFNPLRWARKTEPLRYESSRRAFMTRMEQVSLNVTQLYFNLLLAQVNFSMARQNVENGQKTFEIAKVRHEMGKISQNELLQVQYIVLNGKNALSQAKQDMQTAFLKLKSYVGLPHNMIAALEPTEIPDLYIEPEQAISEAKKNKETWLDFQLRELEASRDLQQAKMERGLNAELFATVGLVNRAESVGQVYQDPVNQQSLSLGLSIPLMDWGRSKAQIKTAEANQKLAEYSVQQDQLNFEQEIITQATLIQSLQSQIAVAREAAEVALRRYEIAGETFVMGTISITELNIAQTEKDQARRIYLQALKGFWESYFSLRMLTLYDFVKQKPIGKSGSGARGQD